MPSRKISSQTAYPFIPNLTPAEELLAKGIVDIYLVIQGAPDTASSLPSLSGSSSFIQEVFLVSYSAGAGVTTYTFKAFQNTDTWILSFDVPNTPGQIGEVTYTGPGDSHGVLVFNSDEVPTSGVGNISMEVEPARTQWHTEAVSSVSFYNIARCNSVEDFSKLRLIGAASSSSPQGDVLSFSDGYNAVVSRQGDVITLTGVPAGGLGRAPTLGDTPGECTASSSSPLPLSVVSTINGITPVGGDIVLEVAGGLGVGRGPAVINVIVQA